MAMLKDSVEQSGVFLNEHFVTWAAEAGLDAAPLMEIFRKAKDVACPGLRTEPVVDWVVQCSQKCLRCQRTKSLIFQCWRRTFRAFRKALFLECVNVSDRHPKTVWLLWGSASLEGECAGRQTTLPRHRRLGDLPGHFPQTVTLGVF